jgi:hypothetical protein
MDTSGEHSVPLRYLIARLENNRLRVFTLTAEPCGETLPIFGTARAAHDFRRQSRLDGGWRVRESTTGELVSLLLGHLAAVESVVLDPSPELADSGAGPKGASKRDFIAALMGEPLLFSPR